MAAGCAKDQPEIGLIACIIHSIAIKVDDSRFENLMSFQIKPSVTKTKRSILNKVLQHLSTANLATYE